MDFMELLFNSRSIQTGLQRTWEDLSQEVDLLLEVSMREFLLRGLHEVLSGIEEVLEENDVTHQYTTHQYTTHQYTTQSAEQHCRHALSSSQSSGGAMD